ARRLSEGDLKARIGDPRRNDELGALSAQFDNMAEALQQQMESRQDLLRNVSHELRSPLARMMIALELAKQAGGDNPHLARIERETEHMDQLTAQILDLARAQAGVQADAPVDLSALLKEIADDAAFEGAPENKAVVLELDSPLPTIHGNATLLRSAFDNIVRNALRYTSPEGRVVIRTDQQRDSIDIAISDAGPGVTDDMLDKLFMPFVKGANSDGSGVGLALSAQIANWHGGSIRANNNPEPTPGLTVTLRLPIPASSPA
ncbi:MAG: HAMP domain-containing sensor histidine kinase, partial [Pseudomonadota bacterium]